MIKKTFESRKDLFVQVQPLMRALLLLSLVGVIAMGAAGSANAQSGRRLPTWNEPKPAPSPEESADTKKHTEKKPPTPLVFARYLVNLDTGWLTDIAVQSCMQRIKQNPTFDLSKEKDMNKKEAENLAKSKEEGYVILISLVESGMGSVVRTNYSELEVEYVVYSPTTGKSKAMGRVLQPLIRNTVQYRVELAGREAADRILTALGAVLPQGRVP